jgi:hypothetical protein
MYEEPDDESKVSRVAKLPSTESVKPKQNISWQI